MGQFCPIKSSQMSIVSFFLLCEKALMEKGRRRRARESVFKQVGEKAEGGYAGSVEVCTCNASPKKRKRRGEDVKDKV